MLPENDMPSPVVTGGGPIETAEGEARSPTRRRRRFLLLTLGGSLVATLAALWSVTRTPSSHHGDPSEPVAVADEHASLPAAPRENPAQEGSSIAPRETDAAKSFHEWFAEGEDVEAMRRLAREAEHFRFKLQQNYPAYGALDGWGDAYADRTPWGRKVAECRFRHEPRQTEPCYITSVQVLRKGSDGKGRVAWTAADAGNAPPACQAWAACVGALYLGREAPWPADPSLKDVLVIKGGIHHFGLVEGRGDAIGDLGDYAAKYEKVLAEQRTVLASNRAAQARDREAGPNEQNPYHAHAVAMGEATVADGEVMLELIGQARAEAQRGEKTP